MPAKNKVVTPKSRATGKTKEKSNGNHVDPYMVDVRDMQGNLLFRYNGRTGDIEIKQRPVLGAKGEKVPAMLYFVNVRQLTGIGDRNIISETPTNTMQVNGIVAQDETGSAMKHGVGT